MNAAEWHLLLIHAPGMGAFFGSVLVLTGCLIKNRDFQRAGLLLFVLGGLLAVPAYLTGQPAMDYLKSLMPTMPTEPAELHAELAVLALGANVLLTLFAFGVLLWSRRHEPLRPWMLGVALVGGLAVTLLMTYASHAGGKIRHPEIRRQA